MTAPFGARLADAVARRGPLCVGIDPHAELLAAWGLTDDVEGLRRFTDAVVEALAGTVAVLKPQSAFYERHGARGLLVLEDAVATCRAAGALVLLDAKRGDIGSTMAGYADVLAPGHPMQVDALTVSPYLGPGSLEPAVRTARAHGGGLFVLARTSNPDAATFQHARLADGRTVAQAVVDTVAGWNDPGWLVGDPAPDPGAHADLQGRWGRTPAPSAWSWAPPWPSWTSTSTACAGRCWPRAGRPGRHPGRPAAAVRRRPGRRPHGLPGCPRNRSGRRRPPRRCTAVGR
ncbi:orotidine-5'-phosphate decarboxylase [Klenkia terrae]|uniref:orotidine-5'-phosphate decarboxylase n=1 Tax=Klenkia terrae TaxID=1052259 RepID=UPI0036165DB8